MRPVVPGDPRVTGGVGVTYNTALPASGDAISGLTALVLPSFIAADGRGGSARYVGGGTLGLAGVVGFLTHRSCT